jgi:hypothetical protein
LTIENEWAFSFRAPMPSQITDSLSHTAISKDVTDAFWPTMRSYGGHGKLVFFLFPKGILGPMNAEASLVT